MKKAGIPFSKPLLIAYLFVQKAFGSLESTQANFFLSVTNIKHHTQEEENLSSLYQEKKEPGK